MIWGPYKRSGIYRADWVRVSEDTDDGPLELCEVVSDVWDIPDDAERLWLEFRSGLSSHHDRYDMPSGDEAVVEFCPWASLSDSGVLWISHAKCHLSQFCIDLSHQQQRAVAREFDYDQSFLIYCWYE